MGATGVTLLLAGAAVAATPHVVTAASPSASASVSVQLAQVVTEEPPNGEFGVSGTVAGLFPGATVVMPLRFTNPSPFAIRVATVDFDVTAPAACAPADAITAGDLLQPVVIPANGSADGALPVSMSAAATDGCQGATFQLQFAGSADEVVPGSAAAAFAAARATTTTAPGSQVLGVTTDSNPGQLRRTGTALVLPTVAGGALCVAGAGLLFAARRRGS